MTTADDLGKGDVAQPPPLRTDYYTSTGRKVADWFLGFVGFYLLAAIFFIVLGQPFYMMGFDVVGHFLGAGFFFAVIMLCIHAARVGRRFIMLGMVGSILIVGLLPLLAFGACVLMFAGL